MHLDMEYYVNHEVELLEALIKSFSTCRKTLQQLHDVYDHIVIYATGSSANAAYSAKPFFAEITQMNVEIKEPSMALHYDLYLDDRTLYFAISQGGHSSSIVHIVEAVQRHHTIYAITASQDSPLTRAAKHILYMDIEEDMPFVTAGESATIVYLWLIALTIAMHNKLITDAMYMQYLRDIHKVIQKLPDSINRVNDWIKNEKYILCEQNRFLCISYGSAYGSAREFETKFTETIRVPSAGFELEEFMHGPYIGIQKQDCIFLFDPDGSLKHRLKRLRSFLKAHVNQIYYFTINEEADEDALSISSFVHEHLTCLLFNIVVHLTSWQVSQIKKVDLSRSSYPDFDEMMKSKI